MEETALQGPQMDPGKSRCGEWQWGRADGVLCCGDDVLGLDKGQPGGPLQQQVGVLRVWTRTGVWAG